MLYSNTGVSGSVADVGSDRHLVLYYWLIPNRNVEDCISIATINSVQAGVKGAKGLECGCTGWIILDRYFNGCIGCIFAGSGGGSAEGVGLVVLGLIVVVFLFLLLLFQRWYRHHDRYLRT